MRESELKRRSKTARYKLGTRYRDKVGRPWLYIKKVKAKGEQEKKTCLKQVGGL